MLVTTGAFKSSRDKIIEFEVEIKPIELLEVELEFELEFDLLYLSLNSRSNLIKYNEIKSSSIEHIRVQSSLIEYIRI